MAHYYRRGGLPWTAITALRNYRTNLEYSLAGRWDGEHLREDNPDLSSEDLEIAERNVRELVKVEACLDILEG